MHLTRALSTLATVTLVAGLGSVALAGPASAGTLVAHDGKSHSGTKLVDAASASYIDVADNKTSSVKNATPRPFSGRNVMSLVSFEVFHFAANATYADLGGADNQIDHFDRR